MEGVDVRSRKVTGVTVVGVRGHLVAVEAHVGRGLPSLTLSGLPGAGGQDARDRIRPAVESAGLGWPLRRVVVNLSPGTLRKEGPGLDLPVAMGDPKLLVPLRSHPSGPEWAERVAHAAISRGSARPARPFHVAALGTMRVRLRDECCRAPGRPEGQRRRGRELLVGGMWHLRHRLAGSVLRRASRVTAR